MVETEQIVNYCGRTYSYVQIRGSVPVFWAQRGVFSPIELADTREDSFAAFSKHFGDLIAQYKRVLIFDLLSEKKEGEAKLSEAYRANAEVYAKEEDANFKYVHFDFHHERDCAVRVGV